MIKVVHYSGTGALSTLKKQGHIVWEGRHFHQRYGENWSGFCLRIGLPAVVLPN